MAVKDMTFLFKIQLKEVKKPPVWRKVIVPANFSFLRFHEVIQAAFGWSNYHLFQFTDGGSYGDPPISMPDPDDWDEIRDARKVKLNQVFKAEGEKYTYIYDFGDYWQHQIVLEKMVPIKSKTAECVDGKGACPPEDCGGAWGYEELKATMADPSNPEHADMKEWLGLEDDEVWDVNAFDLKAANEYVQSV